LDILSKCPIKVRKILETALVSDLGDGKVSFPQEVAGFVDAQFVDKSGKCFSGSVLEKPAKCFLAQIGHICHFF
jgi:hypothetical protein